MSLTRTKLENADRLLSAGCARNVPAELHYEKSDGTLIVARVRLLALTGEHLLTDQPAYSSGSARIPSQEDITVCAMLNGQRYQFRTRIEQTEEYVPLNATKMVLGMALRRPEVVDESQRRHHLRISLASYHPITVNLARPHPEFPDACAILLGCAKGRMIDVSAGGASVLIDRRVIRKVNRGDSFFFSFGLPTVEEPFFMLATIQHYVMVQRSDSLRIGFAFCDWAGCRLTNDQRRLTHFIAEHERRMLRRKR